MHSIAVAHGDGIGPEITQVVLRVLEAVGAPLDIHEVRVGESVYLEGERTGISSSTWDVLESVQAFLKAPISTPQGGGFKSLNVTIRNAFELYANVRPSRSYFPVIETKHSEMDLVIVRENQEDLYTGLEYRQTDDVYEALKLISSSGTEKIVRFAFELALAENRKKVSCFTKDNILKHSDGQFHQVFRQVAQEYPSIVSEHWIVDIGSARLAASPELFDVVVLPNLYGDILSDVASQLSGSVGLGGSANIGEKNAMFEAVHGSAPRYAGQDVANPCGLLLASCMMLEYLGENRLSALIHNALLCTLEQGVHTRDVFSPGVSKKEVGTQAFGEALIARLGKTPEVLRPYQEHTGSGRFCVRSHFTPSRTHKRLVGVDVYIDSKLSFDHLVDHVKRCETGPFVLESISSRGVEVWPCNRLHTRLLDHYQCRFKAKSEVSFREMTPLIDAFTQHHLEYVQVIPLRQFDEKLGFS